MPDLDGIGAAQDSPMQRAARKEALRASATRRLEFLLRGIAEGRITLTPPEPKWPASKPDLGDLFS